MSTALLWFRRDLRLDDHPALHAALRAGHALVPVYLHAPDEEAPWPPGAASRAWLRRSLHALDASMRSLGSRLVVRAGSSLKALEQLLADTGAEAVYFSRLVEPAAAARDAVVRTALRQRGVHVEIHDASLLADPDAIATQAGDPYRVFTPFWRNAQARLATRLVAAPVALPPVDPTLTSLAIDTILPSPSPAWDAGFWTTWTPGEQGAARRLAHIAGDAIAGYPGQRDRPDGEGTSRLSPHLHFGEVSPRRVLATLRGVHAEAHADARHAAGVAAFECQLGWNAFAQHLLIHFPHTTDANLDARFDGFAWADPDPALLAAWQSGRTGVPLVDAGMRELWHTGWMHNRVRMVVASFLAKNLRMHWLHGARWFWDTLVDADLANNTLGWQWTAGTGADAAPYFRVFHPVAQARRFDPDGAYVRSWIPELARVPDAALFEPWRHADVLRAVAPDYPRAPVVDLAASRAAALVAYKASRSVPSAAAPRAR